ncbi:hypothetical protein ACFL3Z_01660 [Gemmatimonadota bacterium]
MVDGLGPALGQLLQGDLVDDGAVLGVDHQHPTGLPQSRGKAEIILVGDDPTRLSAVHIHRRLTGQRTEGHEAFDGGEAGSHHLGNLLQDLRGDLVDDGVNVPVDDRHSPGLFLLHIEDG